MIVATQTATSVHHLLIPATLPPIPGVALRPPIAADLDDLVALVRANLEHLSPWMPWAHPDYGREDVRRWLAADGGSFLITDRDAPVGTIGFNRPDPVNRATAIGYWLDAAHQGRGIVTAAVQGMCEYGFASLGLHRIELRAALDNDRSRAVAARCGFVEEGIAREAEYLGGGFRDLVVYSLLAP